MSGIEGQGIAITGGAGDIGSAIARRLLSEGADVTLLDTRPVKAVADLLHDLEGLGGRVRYAEVDVRDRSSVDVALASMDRLDTAIANAGIVESAPFLDVTAESWQDHIDVNLTGAFNVTQAAARRMTADRTRGHIVLTGSWIGEVPWPEVSAYSVTKAGLQMLARSAARELAPRIRVNVVAPGIVRAGLAKHQLETEPQYARRVARAIPLEELQTADQVADVVGFLCSDAAAYMTGSTLLADGGCSLYKMD